MKIILKNELGGVSIMTLSPSYISLTNRQEYDIISEIAEKISQKNIECCVINDADLPKSKTFRDAWEMVDGGIIIGIDKAREIAHAERRFAREKEFAPLDIKSTIPLEADDAEAKRALIRQKYADIQIRIDSALTVEEIKTAMNW